MTALIPRIGVGVIVLNGQSVLCGLRHGAHGSGTWSFPGGHLHYGESVEECAAREVYEETGLHVTELRRGPYTNDLFQAEGRHYVTLWIVAEYQGGEPQLREPEKCREWRWVSWEALPQPLFLPIINLQLLGYTPYA